MAGFLFLSLFLLSGIAHELLSNLEVGLFVYILLPIELFETPPRATQSFQLAPPLSQVYVLIDLRAHNL